MLYAKPIRGFCLSRVFLPLLLAALFLHGGCKPKTEPVQASKKDDKLAATQPATRPLVRQDVGVDEFETLWRGKKYVVLDVRTPSEFSAGHLAGAVNLDVKGPDFDKKVAELDKQQVYLVHCASGVRSLTACDRMTKLKFEHLYNLQGGFKAWERAGKPVEKAGAQ
jgi:rhodanese-related sulfurtransferase